MNNKNLPNKRECLKYYAFDWDDNILYMPTKIHMENNMDGRWVAVSISTEQFSEARLDKENWRLISQDPTEAFCEFRDNGPRGNKAFLHDLITSCRNGDFAPSWGDFIECLTSGTLFCIVTARGHESPTIRKGVEWIIDNMLTSDEKYMMYNHLLMFSYLFRSHQENVPRIPSELSSGENISQNPLVVTYLDNCGFIGVSAPSRSSSAENPEKAKQLALMEFIQKANSFAKQVGMSICVGFSDDDKKNIQAIEDLFELLVDKIDHEDFSNIINLSTKWTKNPNKVQINKWDFERTDEANSSNFDGTQANVLPFTKWNNMTQRLYPQNSWSRQDDNLNNFNNQLGQARSVGKVDIVPKKNVGIRKKRKTKRRIKKLSEILK